MYNSFFITRLKRRLFPFVFLIKPLTKTAVILLFVFLLLKSVSPLFTEIGRIKNLALSIMGKTTDAIRQENNYTNILVMGIGGGEHEGADLTDSIILANLNIKNKTVSLISIPRDLWIDELQAKINTAYQTGENRKRGVGIILAKATVEEVVGFPVQYGLVIDFHAFEKLVDMVGGVDLNIETPFIDPAYPIEGKETDLCGKSKEDADKVTEENVTELFPCRFEKLVFAKGPIHMDGKTALKFVRSRHSNGDEGTDFARSNRQMKLIEAIKTKVVKPEVFLNPAFLTKISQDLKDDIHTDLSTAQLLTLAKNYSAINMAAVKSFGLDLGTDEKPGLLVNPPVNEYGAWVLTPKSGSWEEIHKKIKLFLGQ